MRGNFFAGGCRRHLVRVAVGAAVIVGWSMVGASAAQATTLGFKGVQGGTAWVDFNGDGRADSCSIMSGNRLQCALSTGTGFGPYPTAGAMDPGYTDGRAWTDFNGDHRADYCRVIGSGSNELQCTVSGGQSFGSTYTSGALDAGYNAGRAWVDVNGDGRADFCRVVGFWSMQVECTESASNNYGQTLFSASLDPGYDASRAWVDANGDGRADFCRVVGAGPYYVQCTLSTGTGFGQTISSGSIDPGYDDSKRWGDVNGDHRADFCRIVGSVNYAATTVSCTLSTGIGFGATFTSPTMDAGYSGTGVWADANGDGKDDYCRQTGNVSATCTLSTGTGFGATFSSVPNGYSSYLATFADFNGDGRADYCQRGSNMALSTVSTGSGFGAGYFGSWT